MCTNHLGRSWGCVVCLRQDLVDQIEGTELLGVWGGEDFEGRRVGLPGITINTSPTDYAPITAMQLARFDGKTWVPFGDVLAR